MIKWVHIIWVLMHHCGTTLETMGNDSFAIGDSLHRHWGFTSSLLGIHFLVIGDSPNFIPFKTTRKFQWNKKSAFFTFFPWKNLYLKNITYLCTRKVRYAFYVCYIYNKTQWNGLPVRVVHLFIWKAKNEVWRAKRSDNHEEGRVKRLEWCERV